MPTLYRVFPYLKTATAGDPGGGLYIPSQGGGRIDNPGVYSVLNLSDAAAGAIAEAFGRIPEWTSALLAGNPGLPGSVAAVARYRLPEPARVCNLDDPKQLLALNLRPSEVVTRDDDRNRAWARRIYDEGGWTGVLPWRKPAAPSYGVSWCNVADDLSPDCQD